MHAGERFGPWERGAAYGFGAFQAYANRYLGGGIRHRVDVVLNAHPDCDGRTVSPDVEGDTDGHRICLYLAAIDEPGDGRATVSELELTAAHEAAHVWAYEHGCSPLPEPAELAGTIDRMDEGMASDLAWSALDGSSITVAGRAGHLAELRRVARRLRRLRGAGAAAELAYVEGEIRAHLLEDGHPERYATYCRVIAATDHDEGTARERAFGRIS